MLNTKFPERKYEEMCSGAHSLRSECTDIKLVAEGESEGYIGWEETQKMIV